jgi:DNA-binding beta-propeller fold protein YncE
VAGNGTQDFGGDNGPSTSAMFNLPSGIALDDLGNAYVADTGNNRVRKLSW